MRARRAYGDGRQELKACHPCGPAHLPPGAGYPSPWSLRATHGALRRVAHLGQDGGRRATGLRQSRALGCCASFCGVSYSLPPCVSGDRSPHRKLIGTVAPCSLGHQAWRFWRPNMSISLRSRESDLARSSELHRWIHLGMTLPCGHPSRSGERDGMGRFGGGRSRWRGQTQSDALAVALALGRRRENGLFGFGAGEYRRCRRARAVNAFSR